MKVTVKNTFIDVESDDESDKIPMGKIKSEPAAGRMEGIPLKTESYGRHGLVGIFTGGVIIAGLFGWGGRFFLHPQVRGEIRKKKKKKKKKNIAEINPRRHGTPQKWLGAGAAASGSQ